MNINEFENFELDIMHDDRLILFSDGLTDQFGGEKNKKFSRARLKQLILMHCEKPVNEIKQIITEEHYVGYKQMMCLSLLWNFNY